MKPKPLSLLNHLTTPCATALLLPAKPPGRPPPRTMRRRGHIGDTPFTGSAATLCRLLKWVRVKFTVSLNDPATEYAEDARGLFMTMNREVLDTVPIHVTAQRWPRRLSDNGRISSRQSGSGRLLARQR